MPDVTRRLNPEVHLAVPRPGRYPDLMPDLTKCPFCGVGVSTFIRRIDTKVVDWNCGSCKRGVELRQSKLCRLNAATARLDALEALAAEQCGHAPESPDDPLEAIRRELARLRAALAPFAAVARGIPDNWPAGCVLTYDSLRDCLCYNAANEPNPMPTIGKYRAVKAATSPGGG